MMIILTLWMRHSPDTIIDISRSSKLKVIEYLSVMKDIVEMYYRMVGMSADGGDGDVFRIWPVITENIMNSIDPLHFFHFDV